MADDVPANSGKTDSNSEENNSSEETESSKKITIHVKTPKEKDSFEVPENCTIKEVILLIFGHALL